MLGELLSELHQMVLHQPSTLPRLDPSLHLMIHDGFALNARVSTTSKQSDWRRIRHSARHAAELVRLSSSFARYSTSFLHLHFVYREAARFSILLQPPHELRLIEVLQAIRIREAHMLIHV